ncbi:MAG: MFS transporter [Treponema sp.]|jgi:MFS family permease|nr:MFS transporter [Treponema sp.]
MKGVYRENNMPDNQIKPFGRFLMLWAGDFYANTASGLSAFALAIFMFEMTGKVTSVALTALSAFLPAMLLNPLAGVLADRFDRRLMMILGDGCSALGLLYILLCMMTGRVGEWQIYLGVGISSGFTALLEPSYKATITDLLTKEQFAKASGLVQAAGSAKFLLSPLIAGFLLTITDIRTVLIIDISTIAVTLPITMFIKKQIVSNRIASVKTESDKQSFFRELAEGWRTISANKGLLWMIVLISTVTFYVGFLQTLFTPMMIAISDIKTLGMVESVSAAGMLIGSLILGVCTVTRKYVNQLVTALVSAGLFIALLGVTSNVFVIAVCAFLFFTSLPFANTSADVLIRATIPGEKQGRAWGLIGALSQFGYAAAYAVSGVLADHVFNPLLRENGALSSTIGRITGVGEGRGIALMLIVSGALLVVSAFIMGKIPSIRVLEEALSI